MSQKIAKLHRKAVSFMPPRLRRRAKRQLARMRAKLSHAERGEMTSLLRRNLGSGNLPLGFATP